MDPYYQWLGIPPEEQPPNHYRLLGINLFEQNAGVIESAANQRMAYLQELTGDPDSLDDAQRILGEVSRARLCLLNHDKREAYDAALRKAATAPKRERSPISGQGVSRQLSQKKQQPKAEPQVKEPIGFDKRFYLIAAAIGMTTLILIMVSFSSNDSEPDASKQPDSKSDLSDENLTEPSVAQTTKQTDRRAIEETQPKAQEEAERKAQEEAERKAQEEAERKAQEEAERKAQEEAERKAQEEAERKDKEGARRKQQFREKEYGFIRGDSSGELYVKKSKDLSVIRFYDTSEAWKSDEKPLHLLGYFNKWGRSESDDFSDYKLKPVTDEPHCYEVAIPNELFVIKYKLHAKIGDDDKYVDKEKNGEELKHDPRKGKLIEWEQSEPSNDWGIFNEDYLWDLHHKILPMGEHNSPNLLKFNLEPKLTFKICRNAEELDKNENWWPQNIGEDKQDISVYEFLINN